MAIRRRTDITDEMAIRVRLEAASDSGHYAEWVTMRGLQLEASVPRIGAGESAERRSVTA